MTNEMHNSYNQFLFHSFLSAVHISNESSRSSSGARHNIPNCVIQYIMPCSWWWTTRFLRNMYSRQKLWNKIDYKNCASRWSLTHSNTMHGTHNVNQNIKYLYKFYFTHHENRSYVCTLKLVGRSSPTRHSNFHTVVVETNNPRTNTKNTEHARVLSRKSINVHVCYVVIGDCTAYW